MSPGGSTGACHRSAGGLCRHRPRQSLGAARAVPQRALNRVGESQARAEVDACAARAQSAGLTPDEKNNETGRRAGQGAAVGGVAAAVGALVTGRGVDRVVRSGAVGAAVGGSAGAVSGAMQEKASATYRHFVQRCLSDKGFEVIGWN